MSMNAAIIPCHVLPHSTADGATNMARDEALLDAVAADPSAAYLRTYEWSEPTLSLGYFQHVADAEGDPRWRGAPVVRRATGGGALWHDREVTYAVVVPAGHPLARPSSALYEATHRAIAAQLRAAGLDAHRFVDGEPAGRGESPDDRAAGRPFLCFADRDGQDVVVDGAKLVGSAQRRRAGAVLQHGSLLLARSPATPELPGLREVGPGRLRAVASDPSGWTAPLREAIAGAIGGPVDFRDWPDSTLDRADTLRRTVYGDAGWTRRR